MCQKWRRHRDSVRFQPATYNHNNVNTHDPHDAGLWQQFIIMSSPFSKLSCQRVEAQTMHFPERTVVLILALFVFHLHRNCVNACIVVNLGVHDKENMWVNTEILNKVQDELAKLRIRQHWWWVRVCYWRMHRANLKWVRAIFLFTFGWVYVSPWWQIENVPRFPFS